MFYLTPTPTPNPTPTPTIHIKVDRNENHEAFFKELKRKLLAIKYEQDKQRKTFYETVNEHILKIEMG
jgi:ribosomal protein L25 (general stress protein Ctc)